jgi:hypothetical protein
VYATVENPPYPLSEIGNSCTPASRLVTSCVETLQVFTISPFDKKGHGDIKIEPIGIKF